MRTTLTLDEDVVARLKAEMRRTGRSFKDTVNHVLRLGLSGKRTPSTLPPFKVRARPMGLRPGLDYDRTNELLEQLEGPAHR